jgi:hypothetical protein
MTGNGTNSEVQKIFFNFRDVLKVAVPGLGSGREFSTQIRSSAILA